MSRPKTSKTPSHIEAEIRSSVSNGRFISDLDDHRWSMADGEFDMLIQAAAELQNSGEIDFLTVITATLDEADDRFAPIHFLTKLMPLLDVSIENLAPAINALGNAGRNAQVQAGQLYIALRTWAEREAARPTAILHFVSGDQRERVRLIGVALEAGTKFDLPTFGAKSIQFTQSEDIDVRRQALGAIGSTNFEGNASLQQQAVDSVKRLWVIGDDEERALALATLFEMLSRSSILKDEVESLLNEDADLGELSLQSLAASLFYFHSQIAPSIIERALSRLTIVSSRHRGTIDFTDMALSGLDWSSYSEVILSFLERVLTRSEDPLSMKMFDHFEGSLLTEKPQALQSLALRWLLNGDSRLADGLARIVQRTGDDSFQFRLDLSEHNDDDRLFVAHKALGSMLLQPVSASTVILSCIRSASDKLATRLASLLFDPLLLNYSGLKDKLDKMTADEARTNGYVQDAIRLHDAYLDTLNSVDNLPELLPSEGQRNLSLDKNRLWQTSIHKEVERQSVFLSIMTKTIVLYGDRTIDYVRGTGSSGETQRVENQMHSHGSSWELPRQNIFDPIGLSYAIFRFRVERR